MKLKLRRGISSKRRETVFFLHIPKCGGTTLIEQVIEKNFLPGERITFYEHSTESLIGLLKDMQEAEQKKIKCIAGHFGYGVHRFYTAGPAHYITLLRDPIERTISHYYHVLRTPDHYLHEQIKTGSITLKDYAAKPISREIDNGQTRILAGTGWKTAAGECTYETFQEAKKNLAAFRLVGILEEFEQFLNRLNHVCGWKIRPFQKLNVSHNRPALHDVDEETLDAIRSANRWDMELYRWVRQGINR